ncbi:MAG: gamma-glutamyltransferase [Bacteroidetes bacterium]|nr:gamma-glutamyltransferase [Bacteroidota bacterium]
MISNKAGLISIFAKIYLILILSIFSIIQFNITAASKPFKSKNGMVVSANKIASKVGVEILKAGGNAVDAAVAVGFALAVTYPYAGNIGGGGFMVIHLQEGNNTTIDFRERAPFTAYRDMYLDKYGNVIENMSLEGAASVGVPGSVSGLIYALERYGTMKLSKVIQPAIDLADNGWTLESQDAESFYKFLEVFSKYPSSLRIFTNNGVPYKEGDLFKQPELAWTLKQIRDRGLDGFYKGKVSDLFVQQMMDMGGFITHADLEKYEPVEREPIIGSYREYKIISMAPPSSGGIALIQLLNILENFNFEKDEWGSSQYLHRIVEAMKYVFVDRTYHLGDADFYPVPIDDLISKEYAKTIFERIKDNAVPSAEIFTGDSLRYYESTETTHYSVYDNLGNAVSVTTTLNSAFGSKVVVEGAGFLLNNEMNDFSEKPGVSNQFGLLGTDANAIEPGKRMLSSMTPTIVLKDNKPYLILGSPGGSMIITTVLQVLMNCIDFNMNIQEAVDMPRIHHQWMPDKIYFEKFAINKDAMENLVKMGYDFSDMNDRITTIGLVQGIMIDQNNKIIYGASDSRGNGSAEGF